MAHFPDRGALGAELRPAMRPIVGAPSRTRPSSVCARRSTARVLRLRGVYDRYLARFARITDDVFAAARDRPPRVQQAAAFEEYAVNPRTQSPRRDEPGAILEHDQAAEFRCAHSSWIGAYSRRRQTAFGKEIA